MSLNMDDYNKLIDSDGNEITSMGASWETGWYSLGKLEHLMISIDWDTAGVTGDLYLDYLTGDSYQVKNQVVLAGPSLSEAWLDANIGAKGVRVRFVRTAGTAAITTVGITLKGSK